MKQTAILHTVGTGAVAVGIFVSDQLLTLGSFVFGGILFVAGIVVARRNDSTDLGD